MNINCILHFLKSLHFVPTAVLFNVFVKVLLCPGHVIAQLTLKGILASVEVHVFPQSLAVSVLMTTNLTLILQIIRIFVKVTSLVASHCRCCVITEPTSVTLEGPLMCMLEQHVLLQGSLLHSSINTVNTIELHGCLFCMFSQHVIL